MTKIAIIGSEKSGKTTLAGKLGKKGNVTDITMYDFAKNDRILTTIDATGYPASVKSLVTALDLSDIALLCIPPEGLDPQAAECIIALDVMGYKHGIVVLTKSDTSYPFALDELKEKLQKVTTGTVLENWEYITISTTSFEGMEELKELIFTVGDRVDKEQRELDSLPTRTVIDQSFNVTGIGCVVLGVVMQGTLNAKDKMVAYPAKKELEIRSIQMHDVDTKSAPAGARVGLALKGVQSKDIDRGFILSEKETVATNFTLKCTLSPLARSFNVDDMLHLYVGLQSSPVRVTEITEGSEKVETAAPGKEYMLQLEGSKEIAYSKNDRFILSNLDEKQRFIAFGYEQ
ncbi:EF-Tu/IF-2/RF-3 family GTPase [Methanolobus profundi]|uniref:Selenocysteine-specific translation elongation factor n=1 Tax=Methanolobus profundi TaxID=487685 RepID=A0A1I4T8L0_9EURY|nr:EF-Tu/IF-2/RF-3 family GTPase [Methanolobus profundi]SFM72933.1 Selenocysteine-specific translation elongation factor [Methanolobus profundi]